MNSCTTCGHGLHDARATWTTCQACQDRITRRLAEIEGAWKVLPDCLEPTRGHSGPRVSGTTHIHAPLPIAGDVLELIGPSGVPTRLYWQYSQMCLARGLAPRTAAAGSDGRFAQALRGIRRHLSWAVQGADLAELSRELGTLASRLSAVTGGVTASGVSCPAELPDGATCTGQLRYDDATRTARCRTCRTCLDPAEWLDYWMRLNAATV